MLRILIFILIVTIGSKAIVHTATAAYKDFIIKSAIQEEESKTEKEENKSSKKQHEEVDWNTLSDAASAFNPVNLPSFLSHQKAYIQFFTQLNTPPPNFI